MSELAEGFSFFLSDKFDNIFKSWASPIKVAYTAGLVTGLGLGFIGRDTVVKAKKAYEKIEERQRRSLPRLTGNTRKELNDMLTSMQEILSANDNALFIDLKTKLGIVTETDEIRELMKEDLPNLHMAKCNDAQGEAQFIAKVVNFLTNSGKIDDEKEKELQNKMKVISRLCFKADIFMIYAEEDYALASDIADGIRKRNIDVALEADNKIGQRQLSSLDNVYIAFEYIFIICTKNLKGDKLASFKTEAIAMHSILNAEARFIPVLTRDVAKKDIAKYLGPITPWNYEGDQSIERVVDLVENSYKTIFMNEFNDN